MKKLCILFLSLICAFSLFFGSGLLLSKRVSAQSEIAFSATNYYLSDKKLESAPNTFESTLQFPTGSDASVRQGVIFGSFYDFVTPGFTFEIHQSHRPRLYVFYHNGTKYCAADFQFTTSLTSYVGQDVHVAITLDRANKSATLYVNGASTETKNLSANADVVNLDTAAIPNVHTLTVGNDLRNDANTQFKGMIKNVACFSSTRTASEIATDAATLPTASATGLLFAHDLAGKNGVSSIPDRSNNGYNLTLCNKDYIVWDIANLYGQNKLPAAAPKTVEATVKFPSGFTARGGVILGNYKGYGDCFGLEVYTNGQIRLYVQDKAGTLTDIKFNVNVATGEWVNVTVVIDGNTAKCYIDGELEASDAYLCAEFMPTLAYAIGGDLRGDNAQYFKGLIKDIAAYSDVRTATEIANDYNTPTVNVNDNDLLFAYDLTGQTGDTIEDLSNNNIDVIKGFDMISNQLWVTDGSITDPTDFDYSFAVVGDTQKMVLQYNEGQNQNFPKIYDYIVNNAESKKIAHVFGLGDITETSADWVGESDPRVDQEFQIATSQISRMDGVVDYSLVRGNHDAWTSYHKYFGEGSESHRTNYPNDVDEVYVHPDGTRDYTNSIHYFTAGKLDYMVITLDYGATDAVLQWASKRISAHPYHNVIITTHAYMFRDGTTLDVNDVVPPSKDPDTRYDKTTANDGDDMWNELISKHPNIVLAMSGHDPCEDVVCSQWKGTRGNTVTNMLIDPQGMDAGVDGGSGAVAMFYFSNEGKTVEVRFWSTAMNCYIKAANQFTFTIDTVAADYTVAEEEISELPELSDISLADEANVTELFSFVSSLSAERQAKISNKDELEALVARIEEMKDEIDNVIALISDLPDEIAYSDKDDIEEAREAYDSLTSEQKYYITNYSLLTDAEKALAALDKDSSSGNENNNAPPTTQYVPVVGCVASVEHALGGLALLFIAGCALLLVKKRLN